LLGCAFGGGDKLDQKWIGVDLDGCLAYDDDNWSDDIGAPIPEMVARVRNWLVEGKDVRIMTARVNRAANGSKVAGQMKKIEAFCIEQFGRPLPVTCAKDPFMAELWDDRCVRVERNTGRVAWLK
jgi:hypothetical protein